MRCFLGTADKLRMLPESLLGEILKQVLYKPSQKWVLKYVSGGEDQGGVVIW